MNQKERVESIARLLNQASQTISTICRYIEESDDQILLDNYPSSLPSLDEIPGELSEIIVKVSVVASEYEMAVGDIACG